MTRHENSLIQTCSDFLPPEICRQTALERLCLNGKLETLPDQIANLKNLTYLSICHCDLERLPDAICELTNLRSLILADNLLEKLPGHLGRLIHLQRLD